MAKKLEHLLSEIHKIVTILTPRDSVSKIFIHFFFDAGPLTGVVVYVAKKLEHLQSEIHKIVTGLGGQIRYQYIPADVTHLVFVGKLNDLTKEFRTARDDKKQIVSPEWIKMCNEEKRHVEEV